MSDQILFAQTFTLKTKITEKLRPPIMESLRGQKKWMYPFPASFWNITNNLAGRFDGFSIIHNFEIFEKHSSDHFQKCATKFQKLKI